MARTGWDGPSRGHLTGDEEESALTSRRVALPKSSEAGVLLLIVVLLAEAAKAAAAEGHVRDGPDSRDDQWADREETEM